MRLLVYSHDSYGLGHLRRCQTISNYLAERIKDLSVLIISGSPVVGSFPAHPRVDFVRIPGVVKLDNQNYAPVSPGYGIDEIIDLRAAIIRETVRRFHPDVFLVDKEPLGLKGEVRQALEILKHTGTRNVLGIREIMDEPNRLREEWRRKGATEAVADLYDEVWIYGPRRMYAPLDEVGLSPETLARVHYTGYLRRSLPEGDGEVPPHQGEPPFVLVTPGGGGDGAQMIDWVLKAYEHDPGIPHRAKIVFGPFLSNDDRNEFAARVARLDKVQALTFDPKIEHLIKYSSGLVTMGGYNTFCEILSFDKPALIVPRTHPRLEQFIRAQRAEELGLARMLLPNPDTDPLSMARAIRALPDQPKPSAAGVTDLIDGLPMVEFLLMAILAEQAPMRLARIGL